LSNSLEPEMRVLRLKFLPRRPARAAGLPSLPTNQTAAHKKLTPKRRMEPALRLSCPTAAF
jgi:hypothetical protein